MKESEITVDKYMGKYHLGSNKINFKANLGYYFVNMKM